LGGLPEPFAGFRQTKQADTQLDRLGVGCEDCGVRKRLLLFVGLALVGSVSGGYAAAGAAGHKVFVERSIVTQQLAYRPHTIELSADGTFAVTGIRWQSYGGAEARAQARAYVRGCTPDCAQGQVKRPRARLRFSNLVQCRGVMIYARLRYSLQGAIPSGDRRQSSISLRPAGEEHGC
jgi:hypothetical protein